MKNLMVANFQPQGTVSQQQLTALLDAQIENSLALGWRADDIVVVSNFAYSFQGVDATQLPLNRGCLRGSKIFALDAVFRDGCFASDDIVWAHDLDAWQNYAFTSPWFRDLGLSHYSQPKFNGGSIFCRRSAGDMIRAVVDEIMATADDREEPAINCVLRSPVYQNRVTVLNSTFNLGCSGFVERYQRSLKPILVSHFHPTNRLAWDTHVNDRNGCGRSASPRLVDLLVRRFHAGQPPEQLARNPHKDKSKRSGISVAKTEEEIDLLKVT
jgi:hypothetical protein